MAKKKEKNQPKIIDVKQSKENNDESKKTKFINYLKDLGLSLIHTKNLFKFGVKHWITPLIVFSIITTLIVIPPYLRNNFSTGDEVVANTQTLYSDKVLAHALSQNVQCQIKEGKLSCAEGYKHVETYTFTNEQEKSIKYNIYINAIEDVRILDEQEYFKLEKYNKDGDNYIALFEDSYMIRFVSRSLYSSDYIVRNSFGFYTELEGYDFSKVYNDTKNLDKEQTDLKLNQEADKIIELGYKAAHAEEQFIQLSSNLLSYLILIAIVAVLIKGTYLLNRRKGFTYSQCIKVTIMASMQSYLIALILRLFGFDLVVMFGLALTARTLYLWARYTSSRKNTKWLDDLYKLTNNERFNITGA